MITGRRAFEGTSPASLLAAILERQPAPMALLNPLTPLALDRLVSDCLAKSPDDRPDTAHDVANNLRWLSEASGIGDGGRPGRHRRLRVAGVTVGVLFAAAIGAALAWLFLRPPATSELRRTTFDVLPPAGDHFTRAITGVAIAPDGSGIAFVALHDGVRRLFVKRMDRSDTLLLNGTEGADAPFYSPDGRWVGFFASGTLKKVAVAGGPPVPICEAGSRRGATWTGADSIVFGSGSEPGLMRVDAAGGEPTPLTVAAEGESHAFPDALPGGLALLFTIRGRAGQEVAALEIDSRRQRTLFPGTSPRFVRPGHLAYVHDGALWLTGFNPQQLTPIGKPVRAIEIPRTGIGGFSEYSVSQNGDLVFKPLVQEGGQLEWVDRAGSRTVITGRTGFTLPRLSPEGRRIAAIRQGMLEVYDLDRGTFNPVTSDVAQSSAPVWSPDGKRLLYSQDGALYTVPADASGPPVRVGPDRGTLDSPTGAWLDDGTIVYVAFVQGQPTGLDIWLQPASGSARPIVATPNHELAPAFSPDRQWLAYLVGPTFEGQLGGIGRTVYAQRYPSGPRIQVSVTNGGAPRWRRDGRELFYVSERGEMMSVPVDPQASVPFGQPQVLFGGVFSPSLFSFDVGMDGRMFLATPAEESQRIVVVLNWLEELKATAPPTK